MGLLGQSRPHVIARQRGSGLWFSIVDDCDQENDNVAHLDPPRLQHPRV